MTQSGPSFTHAGPRGEIRLSLPAPTVLLMEYKGYSDEAFVDFIERVWDETFASSPCTVQIFADTEGQTGYASSFRVRLMEWSKRMVARTDTYCLLVKSRWVAMGIAIVRSTLGTPAAHAEVTTSRGKFRSKLDDAVRRSLESSGVPVPGGLGPQSSLPPLSSSPLGDPNSPSSH